MEEKIDRMEIELTTKQQGKDLQNITQISAKNLTYLKIIFKHNIRTIFHCKIGGELYTLN